MKTPHTHRGKDTSVVAPKTSLPPFLDSEALPL